MTRLGINQFTLLKRGYPNKRLFVSDVSAIYNISHKRDYHHDSGREMAICEKLVNRGYLKKCFNDTTGPRLWWELTEKGKVTVEECWEDNDNCPS